MTCQKKILVNVIANKKIGLGHVYNILTILPHFKNDEIFVVMNKKNSLGIDKFKERVSRVQTFENTSQLFQIIKKFSPDIIINDILNTNESYVKKLKKFGIFVINFEDLGRGSDFANLVFNPIYYQKSTSKKFFGEKYACVREEFRKGRKNISKNSVVITFGGVDPKKLTIRVLKILKKFKPNFKIIVIVGHEFSHKDRVFYEVEKVKQVGIKIEVVEKTDAISKFIDSSMFVITANGRTVFEVASRNIPIITISANPREEKHEFPIKQKIGYHLGLHSQVRNKEILEAIKKMEKQKNRFRFEKNLEKINLKNSVYRVEKIICDNYKEWLKKR